MNKKIKENVANIWCLSKEEFENLSEEKQSEIKKKDQPKKRRKHCEEVFSIISIIMDEINLSESTKKEAKIAALLHDIKKYVPHHAEEGADYVKHNLKMKNLGKKNKNISKKNIRTIIKYHSSPKKKDKLYNEKNKIDNEIKESIFIIRIADTLSKEKEKSLKNIKEIINNIYINSIDNIVSEEEKEKIENILINYFVKTTGIEKILKNFSYSYRR